MLPIAENLSVYIVSSFEIRQYSCTPRLHKRKNFLAMGQRFCKKTALFSGAALLLLAAVPGVLLAVLLKLPAPKKIMVPAVEQR